MSPQKLHLPNGTTVEIMEADAAKKRVQDKLFKTSVVVEPGRLGRLREIRSVQEAISTLHGRWPEVRGKRYYAALKALDHALEGQTPVHVARRAFVAAAEEARVLVPENAYHSGKPNAPD